MESARRLAVSRGYRSVRTRANIVYSVDDVMQLYKVCRNTVCTWVGSGLGPIDDRTPQLFRGAELSRFHEERYRRTRSQLRPGEFKCLGCRAAVFPDVQTLNLGQSERGKFFARAICPDCSAVLMKLVNQAEWDRLEICHNTNTSLVPSDEVDGLVQACVGKQAAGPLATRSANDRILYEWQIYARRYDAKTVDAHLTSIRDFEVFQSGKPFGRINPGDCDKWRSELIARTGKETAGGGLSRSTVRHRASHLKAFFTWLRTRKGLTHLAGAAEYFSLPRGALAVGGGERSRDYPTLDEAVTMLEDLPSSTLMERRNRAIFALAFIAALRESALVSLRLGHVDLERKQVFHDGAILRAKNGKTFMVDFFPRTEPFQTVFRAWYQEARAMGLRENDALFPDARTLELPWKIALLGRTAIPPMCSSAAVDAVFRKACARLRFRYTPHSARHAIAQLGDQVCRTPEERKAWSLNMGHSSEKITAQYYGRVTDAKKSELLRSFDLVEHWPEEDLRLMLRYHEHRLQPDSLEFDRAESLVERSRKMRKLAG